MRKKRYINGKFNQGLKKVLQLSVSNPNIKPLASSYVGIELNRIFKETFTLYLLCRSIADSRAGPSTLFITRRLDASFEECSRYIILAEATNVGCQDGYKTSQKLVRDFLMGMLQIASHIRLMRVVGLISIEESKELSARVELIEKQVNCWQEKNTVPFTT